jgi:hypothetical protein
MLSPLGKLGRVVGRSFTLLGSFALKLRPIRRLLLLLATAAGVVILCSLLLTVVISQA